MNQLDLILENIRLGQIEKLYQEAESDLEIIRGQRLINESFSEIKDKVLSGTKKFIDTKVRGCTAENGYINGNCDSYNPKNDEHYTGSKLTHDGDGNFKQALSENTGNTVGQFIDNNRGKIAAGLGAGAALGGTSLAGRGYFGVEPQDWVHDKVAPMYTALKGKSAYNDGYASSAATGQVLTRNDNLVGTGDTLATLEYQILRQPEFHTSKLYNKSADALASVAGLNKDEAINYVIRNPMDATNLGSKYITSKASGYYDGMMDNI